VITLIVMLAEAFARCSVKAHLSHRHLDKKAWLADHGFSFG
jgi:hypothetical protein